MSKSWILPASAAGLVALAAVSTDLHLWSTQEALNVAATGLIDPTQLRRYSTQEAANLIAQSTLASIQQDSMVATVVFEFDDNFKETWRDSLLINDTGAAKKRILDLLTQYGIKCGFSVSAYYIEHGDTANTTLSKWELQALRRRGHEMCSGGWDEKDWFNGNSQIFAQGNYTHAQFQTEMLEHFDRNVRAMRDTLGLGAPRVHSASNSSATAEQAFYMTRAGIDYQIVFPTTLSVPSGRGYRPNELYPLNVSSWGMWGTGGTAGQRVAAIPGQHLSPYEVLACIAETSDTSATYKVLRRAMQTRGLVIWNGHKFSTWENNLQQQDGVQDVLEWIAARVAEGRMRVLVPSQAFDIYYLAPVSPSVIYYTDSFQDLDGDTHVDWWAEGVGGFAAGDTAMLTLKPGTLRHGGKRAYGLNWAGAIGSGVCPNPNASAPDSAQEASNATMIVCPPQGAGWTAKFEIWVCVDTTVGSPGLAFYGSLNSEVGVTFWASGEKFQNRYGVTAAPSHYWPANTQVTSSWQLGEVTSMGDMTQGNAQPYPSNTIRLQQKVNQGGNGSWSNNIYRPSHEWAHLIATYEVPEYADYLWIALWKDAQFVANEIVVSDYKLTFFKRGNN